MGRRYERRARELAGWLQARGAEFAPLRVRAVRAAVRPAGADAGPVIDLTVLLDEPADPTVGWPAERLFALIAAVNRECRRRGDGPLVQVFPEPAPGGGRG